FVSSGCRSLADRRAHNPEVPRSIRGAATKRGSLVEPAPARRLTRAGWGNLQGPLPSPGVTPPVAPALPLAGAANLFGACDAGPADDPSAVPGRGDRARAPRATAVQAVLAGV